MDDLFNKVAAGGSRIPITHSIDAENRSVDKITLNFLTGLQTVPMDDGMLFMFGRYLSNSLSNLDIAQRFGNQVDGIIFTAACPPSLLFKIPHMGLDQLSKMNDALDGVIVTDFNKAYIIWAIRKKLKLPCMVHSDDCKTATVNLAGNAEFVITFMSKRPDKMVSVLPASTSYSVLGLNILTNNNELDVSPDDQSAYA
jgi:hypothetical protein